MDIKDIKKRFKDREPGVIGRYRYFSVMVPVVLKDGELWVLYEVRAEAMKRQPGEVCFPGGMLEGKETPLEGAIRETVEELGIEEGDISVIAQLDSVLNYSGFTIYCFLGQIPYEKLNETKVNQEEVKETFLVPLSFLMEKEPLVSNVEIGPIIREDFPFDAIKVDNDYHWRRGWMDIPIYNFNDKIIWGITGRITLNFVRILKNEIK